MRLSKSLKSTSRLSPSGRKRLFASTRKTKQNRLVASRRRVTEYTFLFTPLQVLYSFFLKKNQTFFQTPKKTEKRPENGHIPQFTFPGHPVFITGDGDDRARTDDI